MKKGLLLLTVLLAISLHAFAFNELGTSHKDCERAQKDALSMADGHCIGIDTEGVTKASFGKCVEQKVLNHKTFKVHIYYTCKLPTYDKDYDEDFASN